MDTVDGSCTSIAVITTATVFQLFNKTVLENGLPSRVRADRGGKCTGGNLHVISPPQRTRKGKFYCWP